MANEEEDKKKEGGGSPWLPIMVAAMLSLVLGAGGAFFVVTTQQPAESGAQAEEPEVDRGEAAAAAFKERLYSLEPFVVNVTGDGYSRFLKVKVEIEAEDPSVKAELDARISQIRDALIVLLSSKRLSDITDYEGKALLKEDILVRINDLLESGEINSVLFTEFVVQ